MAITLDDLLAAKDIALDYLHDTQSVRRALKLAPLLSQQDARAIRDGNIHAVGVGRKIVNGKLTRQRCVRLYVMAKLPKKLLTKRHIIPKNLNGIPVDVIESPVPWLAAPPPGAKRVRPLRLGYSCAHVKVGAGTIGGFVQFVDPPRPGIYILSCSHVLAPHQRARPRDKIIQPGPADGGTSGNNLVALLSDRVKLRVENVRDVAVAKIRGNIRAIRTYRPFGRISNDNMIKPGDRHDAITQVCKYGRTTGASFGYYEDFPHTASLKYRYGNRTVVRQFHKQIRIRSRSLVRPFSERGDSGSLVIERDGNRVIGMLIGSQRGFAIVTPIYNVLKVENKWELEFA